MWICPKCGREFGRQNQSHYCGKKPENVDEYIAGQPEVVQKYLKEVRDTLRHALPEAKECISWSMPTYRQQHNIIHFAACKKHVGVYAGTEAVEMFAEELKEYKSSKGSIQFPYNKPIPLDLIAKIARWCYETGNHP